MFKRRTSVYTIHLNTPRPGLPTLIATGLAASVAVQDIGGVSVSFRAPTDDDAALQVAAHATAGRTGDWTLTTGLGVHRRQISPV